jgi:hypothetical protein
MKPLGVQIIPVASTAKAASLAALEPESAAICGKICAGLYELNVVSENVQDAKDNCTRFFVLSNESDRPTSDDKTLLMFSVRRSTLHRASTPRRLNHNFRLTIANPEHCATSSMPSSGTKSTSPTLYLDLQDRWSAGLAKTSTAAAKHSLVHRYGTTCSL